MSSLDWDTSRHDRKTTKSARTLDGKVLSGQTGNWFWSRRRPALEDGLSKQWAQRLQRASALTTEMGWTLTLSHASLSVKKTPRNLATPAARGKVVGESDFLPIPSPRENLSKIRPKICFSVHENKIWFPGCPHLISQLVL